MEQYTKIESFLDLDDATTFLQSQLYEMARDGWVIESGSGINYVNHQWRVGLSFSKTPQRAVEASPDIDLSEFNAYLNEGD
jgi:hypothetical protein